jgi:HlyD family secretion protein
MDREISQSVQLKKKRKKWLLTAVGFVAIVFAIFGFRNLLHTKVDKSKLRIATVTTGNIEQTLTASGEIIPEFEQRLVTPIQARIESVILPAGSVVEANQSILSLNKEFARNERDRILNEWKLSKNALSKLKFQLERGLLDIDTKLSIQKLRMKQLQQRLEDSEHLVKVGGKNQKEADQAKLDLDIAQLEISQLDNDLISKKGSMKADLDAQQIQVSIAQQALNELDAKLKKADVAPNRKGIVTWVNEKIGSMLQANEEVARVADLSTFRVVGSISSVHADKLSSGMPAIVQVNKKELRGIIVNVQPEVTNNTVKFIIALEDKSDASLRPNMRVQVYVVTGSQENTLKIANGPAFTGKYYQKVFVLKGDQLEKREVKVGLVNFDEVELTGNVKKGEQIVISSLKEYEHLDVIKLE